MLDFFKVTGFSLGSSARVMLAQLRGVGATGQDADAEPYDGAEVVFPPGFLARPVLSDTLEALGWRDGDEIIPFALIDKGLAAIASLVEGEVRVHGLKALDSFLQILDTGDINVTAKDGQKITITANGATVVVDTNGDVIVTPKSGQKVKLGGTGGQPAMMGTDVNGMLSDLRTAVNSIITDLATVKSHVHPFTGTGTVQVSPGLSAIGAESSVGAPPALAQSVEVK